MPDKNKTIRETDTDARSLAKTLLRTARYGALAVLDPQSGRPLASRVAVATDTDGAPIVLVSALSSHTPALLADCRSSLLLGEPGKGDPLAHPRITLLCSAYQVGRSDPDYERLRRRYLNRHPKARLYIDLGDFTFFRFEMEGASLNGGFGKAFVLTGEDLISHHGSNAGIAAAEQPALDHMNSDHPDAIALYARHFANVRAGSKIWRISGIDAEGFDLLSNNDDARRVFFDMPLENAEDIHRVLVQMAKQARRQVPESNKTQ
ncbi:pyridoxamine 5'-phosphate oxidase [Paramesorhizobium deserti]|uniref:Pyridoxamine 5'-phosphate oxidase n=1 Tax=Paramesorhizobium deserti TaxID=1494590 RepID=A0A135HU20_9HYPH|nr:DUF2470 domain-containing protein [Paramesorhizobium deserti]KXF76682.1 pyridoxamine 5'-phosphate oxidase [Paramesorhizobium deserti]